MNKQSKLTHRMCKIIYLFAIIVVLSSCNLKKQNTNQSNISQKQNIEKLDNGYTLFNDDNFKIDSKFKFEQTMKSDTLNSYQFQDFTNMVFFRINVANLQNSLISSGKSSFDSIYKKNFFDTYISNLKKDKTDSKFIKFLNRDALVYGLMVTNDTLVKSSKALFKTRMLVMLNSNKSYTLSVISAPEKLNESFNSLKDGFYFLYDEGIDSYVSIKYKYSIPIPKGYIHEKINGKHIDFKVVSKGASILVNVSDRLPEEYKISAHDYTKEFFENTFHQYDPNAKITYAEKLDIDNNKAFLIKFINKAHSTETLEIYFFRGKYAYVLTGTSMIDDFKSCEKIFISTFNSLKFLD